MTSEPTFKSKDYFASKKRKSITYALRNVKLKHEFSSKHTNGNSNNEIRQRNGKKSGRVEGIYGKKYSAHEENEVPNGLTVVCPFGTSAPVVWGIRIQPTFALVRVVRGD